MEMEDRVMFSNNQLSVNSEESSILCLDHFLKTLSQLFNFVFKHFLTTLKQFCDRSLNISKLKSFQTPRKVKRFRC